MATPVFTTSAAYLNCPKCGDGLEAPGSGSFLWLAEEIHGAAGTVEVCSGCGTKITITVPKRVPFV